MAAIGTAGRVRSRAKPTRPATVLARRMPQILADEVGTGIGERQPGDEHATVNPMPAVTARPSMCRHVADVGRRPTPRRTASHAAEDADGLADDEPERDAGQHPPRRAPPCRGGRPRWPARTAARCRTRPRG